MAPAPKDDPTKDDPTKDDPTKDDSDDKYVKQIKTELNEIAERQRRGHATRPPRARGRTTPIAVRFDEFTIKRLKDLATRRNIGYQTLLKEFVVERLYEEEKRERIIE
jgi:predicted DNA binding CopG/RHH family protein